MKYSGVIFDFNGTLFWDTPLHNKAWNSFLEKHDLHFSDNDFFRLIHGKNNKDIFLALFGSSLDDLEIDKFISEKEKIYRDLCIETNFNNLAPGVIDFLTFLKQQHIPYTIATASGKENLDFYFDFLSLSNWFDYDNVVYNNGIIKGKPNPEIYEIAMTNINRPAKETLIFEDAIAGLQAAENALAGKIIAVNSNNDDYSELPQYQAITHFDQVDRYIFATKE